MLSFTKHRVGSLFSQRHVLKRLFFVFAFMCLIAITCKLSSMQISAYTSGDYTYEIIGNSYAQITGYSGTGTSATIPNTLPNPAQSNTQKPVKVFIKMHLVAKSI
ncbi:hypothetical protein FACS1894132_09220 [Clostridia bacterium]|nr:hypothetical protein FACS1894132_09220 [Clostridia bacterium]